MNILFATSEAAPFVKTGGLGDVAGSLPVTLKKKGADIRVILPLYRCISKTWRDQMTYLANIYIDIGWRKQYCGVFSLEREGCTYYFVDNEFYFNGPKPYDFIHLDCEKFIFFSKAVLSLLPTLGFRPDVIHCNDWQTAAIPVFLDTFRDNPFFERIKTVMTIHNLKFQGRWDLDGIRDAMGIGDYYFTSDKLEYYNDANLLKGGIAYADRITTVSESYAGEIQTPEYGEGLYGLLSARADTLSGIVNGIDYNEWNPAKDALLPEAYDQRNAVSKKKLNKKNLQEQLNLPVDENKFVVGMISRLTDQKGFDLLAQALDQIADMDLQLIVLGTGEERYENLFRHYAWKYPEKISANIYFSNERAHLIYAACDAFLMPSAFEPCGLSQLISLHYGTVPIVRETGGLKDTVVPYNEYTGEGDGFSFAYYNSDDMMHVLRYAADTYYNHKDSWTKLMKNGMKADFSWDQSAEKYLRLYEELLGLPHAEKKQEEKKAEKKEEKKEEKKPAPKKEAKKPAVKKAKGIAEKAEPAAEEPKKTPETAPKKETAKPEEKTVKAEKPVKKTEETAKTTAEKKPAKKTVTKKKA